MRSFALVDDQLVEDTLFLRRGLGMPRMRCMEPLVRSAEALGSVLRDRTGQWRMWYAWNVARDPAEAMAPYDTLECLALSKDGLNWEFPKLGIVQEGGSRDNNIVMGPRQRDHAGRYLTGYRGPSGLCVVDAETHPHPAARGRFTAMYCAFPMDRIGGICMTHSDDGINWTAYPENPVIIGSQDTQNCFFWDPRLDRYVCYQRPTIYCGVDRHANRRIARLDSEDLVHWGLSRMVLDTDERDAPAFDAFDEPGMRGARGRNKQFQGISPFPYNDTYLAFTWFYDVRQGVFSNELIHSDDGFHWKREALREPFIAEGRPEGFHGKLIVPIGSPPVLVADELYMYTTATPFGHHEMGRPEYARDIAYRKAVLDSYDMYLLSIQRDRFVGYEAGEHEAEFLSTPIHWEGGGRFYLNIKVDAGGYMKVAFEDQWARPMPECHLDEIPPISGAVDAVDYHLTFGPGPKTVVKFPVPGPFRIRLRMKKATVYGWAVE